MFPKFSKKPSEPWKRSPRASRKRATLPWRPPLQPHRIRKSALADSCLQIDSGSVGSKPVEPSSPIPRATKTSFQLSQHHEERERVRARRHKRTNTHTHTHTHTHTYTLTHLHTYTLTHLHTYTLTLTLTCPQRCPSCSSPKQVGLFGDE